MHSDWFFLGRDFAIRTISMETVIGSVFFLFSKAGKLKLCNQTTKRKRVNAVIFAKKLPKRLIFLQSLQLISARKANIHEANFIILKIWNSNVKTQSGIGEIREATRQFYKDPKSANTNKMATDLNTLLH